MSKINNANTHYNKSDLFEKIYFRIALIIFIGKRTRGTIYYQQ